MTSSYVREEEEIKFDSTPSTVTDPFFIDGTDAYANNYKAFITFYYMLESKKADNNRAVAFKAFVTNFSDTFKANWNPTEVYGRGDPIYTYKSTSRSPSLSFDVIASTDEEAYGNLEKVQKLAQFTYPAYSKLDGGPKIISNAPYVKIGFMNLLTNVEKEHNKAINFRTSSNTHGGIEKLVAEYSNGLKGSNGLLVALQDVTFNFDLKDSNSVLGKGAIFPRKISVTVNFYPIHQHELDGSTISENTSFPYATNITNEANRKEEFTVNPNQKPDTYLDKTFDGIGTINNVVSEGKARQAKLAETKQKVDIANARYNSLFGGLRLNRDERIMSEKGIATEKARDRATENVINYYLGDFMIDEETRALSEPYPVVTKE